MTYETRNTFQENDSGWYDIADNQGGSNMGGDYGVDSAAYRCVL